MIALLLATASACYTPAGEVGNLKCGLPPLPPLNCTVGPCVCDQSGNNCQWTFICK